MDKVFANGMYFNRPLPQAPDFVIGNVSINKKQFIEWLNKQSVNDGGYLSIDIKESKKGKPYCELNTYQKKAEQAEPQEQDYTQERDDSIRIEDVPF